MARPVRHSDVAETLGRADDCELIQEVYQAMTSIESKIEDAVSELHRLAIVARELAIRHGCAPMSHMESLVDSAGEPGEPYA